MNPLLRLSGLAALALVLAVAAGSTSGSAAAHESGLDAPRADVLANGQVVISFTAAGELSGALTLTLTPGGSGSYSGEWAFMVAHTDNADPATGKEPPPHDHSPDHGQPADHSHAAADHAHGEAGEGQHRDYVQLVHRGSLSGLITDAIVTFDASGKLESLVAPLTVDRGTLEFAQAHGTGQATLAGLSLVF